VSRPPHPRAPGLAVEHRRRGTTHAEEARAAGVSLPTWKRWVACRGAPSPGQLESIAERWGIPVAALLAPPKARAARVAARAGAAAKARARLLASLERLAAEHGADAVRLAVVDL
jgi:transcriptional regulator with XRE-family HTH domain